MAKLIDNNLFRIVNNDYRKYTLKSNPYYKIEIVGSRDIAVKERFRYKSKTSAFKKFLELSKNVPYHQYIIFTYHYCKLDLSGKWIASSNRTEGIVWSEDLGLHINKIKIF